MIKKVNIEEIVRNNPNIDVEYLKQFEKNQRELKQLGHNRMGYYLERISVKIFDERTDERDRRLVFLMFYGR